MQISSYTIGTLKEVKDKITNILKRNNIEFNIMHNGKEMKSPFCDGEMWPHDKWLVSLINKDKNTSALIDFNTYQRPHIVDGELKKPGAPDVLYSVMGNLRSRELTDKPEIKKLLTKVNELFSPEVVEEITEVLNDY